jgi:hypothetical protein
MIVKVIGDVSIRVSLSQGGRNTTVRNTGKFREIAIATAGNFCEAGWHGRSGW